MRYNKKGVSNVVTVLIIVALSIVAIGIVWKVILPMFTAGTENINYGAKCLEVNLKPTSLNCVDVDSDGNYECTVGLERDAGTGEAEFNGVIVVFSDTTNEKTVPKATGNIGVLETKTFSTVAADEITFAPTKVQIAVYFLRQDGTKYICSGTNKYTKA